VRIGIDLDNTLADYSAPLSRLCAEHGIEPGPNPKLALRGHLRAAGREDEWTRLQGELYGPLMREAQMFVGAREVIGAVRSRGLNITVVSHRTKHPIAGEKHDLHFHAQRWLEDNGVGSIEVFFEESKEAKIERIRQLRCGLFVDDLPEILTHPEFPAGTRRILFDPGRSHPAFSGLERAAAWSEISSLFEV